jgi:hypothetical protein
MRQLFRIFFWKTITYLAKGSRSVFWSSFFSEAKKGAKLIFLI